MDQYLYKETINPSDEKNPAIEKRMFYVSDQNGGAYNGQIQFDTSVLANSMQYLAYSEGYLEIPFCVSLQGTTDKTGLTSAFFMGLKNGYYQLIDSIQVDYNNTNVVQQQPFTNFYVNYKLMTSMSSDDVQKWGPTIGFYPDSAGSHRFSNAAAAGGDGYSNNADLTTLATFTAPNNANIGFLERRKRTTAFNGTRGGAAGGYGALPTLTTSNQCLTIGKNNITDNNGIGAARIYTLNVLAQIRLKDIADFFSEIPLLKGAFMRLQINYNSCTNLITTAAAGPTMVIAAAGVTMLSGRTNPVLLPSSTANNSGAGLVVNDGNISISCGVLRNTLNTTNSALLSSCRLYVPAYTLDPLYERDLLTITPDREIRYNDIYTYTFSSIATGASFNQILTNGIVNPQYVVLMPYANSSVATSVFANVTTPVYQSPFDTAPGTTLPMGAITNFQVQVAGQNMFQAAALYDFETFNNETSRVNAINGGASTGLNNGLIGHFEWDNAYRYYVCDVSRRIAIEDDVPKSIVVSGTNATGVSVDYICFVVFQRKIRVSMADGAVLG